MRLLFRKLFTFILKGWFISLIGVTALALVVWFYGPLLSIGEKTPLLSVKHRVITIVILFLLWVLRQVWVYFRNKRRNKQFMESMVEDEGPSLDEQATSEELSTLKQRLEEALGVLKKARLGKKSGKRFLYQLPWYMLIGPPGAGKTTLLANSDLKFPLADQYGKDAIGGVGGTRNCDWWFTEDAVLLDTAGRYTTQDSNSEVDSRSWLGFLDLLKKYRKRRPLNGAIVAVSIDDMLRMSEAERITHASNIRARLHELQDHLKVRFPVYMLFTKSDLMAGFMEFFDDLNHDNRSQVWGMTFDYNEDPEINAIDKFDEEFTLLEQRLHQQLIGKLEHERNAERRDLTYTFPQQFSATRSLIGQFVKEIFQSSRYQHAIMVRGVYFTSATQEGSPIDRLMGSLANQFGLAHENLSGMTGSGKSFFINKLFSQVVFSESELAGTNLRFEKKLNWIKGLSLAAVFLLTAVTLFAWTLSFHKNKSYIQDIDGISQVMTSDAAALVPDDKNVLSSLPLLTKAHNISVVEEHDNKLQGLRYGLNQAGKLSAAATGKYQSLLMDAFLPRISWRLEKQLEQHQDDSDFLFEALKVYLMLDDKEHYNADTVKAWVSLDWDNNLPYDTSAEQREELLLHLDNLLNNQTVKPSLTLNSQLVQQTREILLRTPMAQRVYGRLKLELANTTVKEFKIIEAAGRDAPLVFIRKSGEQLNKGVAGLYTYNGYHKAFQPESKKISKRLADESWILGEDALVKADGEDLETLEDDVLKLYLEDFAREWETLIADIRIVPFANLEQAVEILNILSAENSPLKKLFLALNNETDLARVEKPEKGEGTDGVGQNRLVQRGAQKAKNKLSAIVNRAPGAKYLRRARVTTSIVSSRFKRINSMVSSEDGSTAPIDITLSKLNELYIHLNALLQATGDELVLGQRKVIAQKLQKIKTEAKRQPFPLNKMLSSIANSSSSLVNGDVCEHINTTWKSEVYQFCAQAINNRYPIRKKRKSIAQEDFAMMFGPGGKVESFFDKYLKTSIDSSGDQWRWEVRDNNPACASNLSLKQFQNAKIIKDTFFRFGNSLPSTSFSLKPVSMSQNITKLSLNIDGQKMEYAHGPVRSTALKWPGPDNTGNINMQLTPPLPNNRSGITFDGPWALFRLFDQATITRIGQSENYIVQFEIDGREITFELRANSTNNPFNLTALHNFSCPPVL